MEKVGRETEEIKAAGDGKTKAADRGSGAL